MSSCRHLKAGVFAPDPLIGLTIDRRYTILEILGRGGMGCVYKAHQGSLNRNVAIKILSRKAGYSRKKEFQLRFLKEAATSARLKHPNTITIFDYGSEVISVSGKNQTFFYIIMEYLDGVTLRHALRNNRFSLIQKINIIFQIARSLREAHSVGVVHRDLKPSNIMLIPQSGADGELVVKVLDFGLAKTFSDGFADEGMTREGMFLGSPKYVSPEQIEGALVDYRSDIYALGCVMYRILEGKVPFDGESSADIMLKHLHDDVEPFTRKIPKKLENLVFSCLQKSHLHRPQRMAEVLMTLKEIRFEHEELIHHSRSWKKSKMLVEEVSESMAAKKLRKTLDSPTDETRILGSLKRKKVVKKQEIESLNDSLPKYMPDFDSDLNETDTEWDDAGDSLLPGFSDTDYGSLTFRTIQTVVDAAHSEYPYYDEVTQLQPSFWRKVKNSVFAPFKSSI